MNLQAQATLVVPSGRWWIHATLDDADGKREITWRLPVNVGGSEQSIALTPDNAYARAKKF